jgi:hypothetical protein
MESEAAPAASSAVAAPAIGKPRHVLAIIFFSIITFGIYNLVWTWKTYEEMKRYSGRGVGGWVGLLIQLVIGIVTPYLMASEVGHLYEQDGQQPPVSGLTGLWYFPGMFIIVGPIVWLCKTQWALNRFWRAKGAV